MSIVFDRNTYAIKQGGARRLKKLPEKTIGFSGLKNDVLFATKD
jgi:hypothetical protein